MSRYKYRNLISLMLLMYCGQALALPLLSCCGFMNQILENEMLEHHDHASMAMSSDKQQMISESDEFNFNFHCDYCGIASIVLVDIIDLHPQVLAKHNSSYSFLLHSTANDSPFKPPISA